MNRCECRAAPFSLLFFPIDSPQVGAAEIARRIVDDLKDENEQYRKMVMETVDKVISSLLVRRGYL